MSTIPKEIMKQIETYIRFISDQIQREVAKAAIEFGYKLATDGREELEKENADLKNQINIRRTLDNHESLIAHQSQLTGKDSQIEVLTIERNKFEAKYLESDSDVKRLLEAYEKSEQSLKEKEKECEELKKIIRQSQSASSPDPVQAPTQ